MLVYLFLFATGMANDMVLTSYYVQAAKGRRWLCVGLALLQQILSIGQSFYTLADVPMGSPEQLKRWIVVAASYGVAAYVIVKPQPDSKAIE